MLDVWRLIIFSVIPAKVGISYRAKRDKQAKLVLDHGQLTFLNKSKICRKVVSEMTRAVTCFISIALLSPLSANCYEVQKSLIKYEKIAKKLEREIGPRKPYLVKDLKYKVGDLRKEVSQNHHRLCRTLNLQIESFIRKFNINKNNY